jgi:hypothetical protein
VTRSACLSRSDSRDEASRTARTFVADGFDTWIFLVEPGAGCVPVYRLVDRLRPATPGPSRTLVHGPMTAPSRLAYGTSSLPFAAAIGGARRTPCGPLRDPRRVARRSMCQRVVKGHDVRGLLLEQRVDLGRCWRRGRDRSCTGLSVDYPRRRGRNEDCHDVAVAAELLAQRAVHPRTQGPKAGPNATWVERGEPQASRCRDRPTPALADRSRHVPARGASTARPTGGPTRRPTRSGTAARAGRTGSPARRPTRRRSARSAPRTAPPRGRGAARPPCPPAAPRPGRRAAPRAGR